MRQPRQGYHKPQHEVFIRCMLRHGDITKAYRAAYPKASVISARTAGIRLYNQPHIRSRIEPILQLRRDEADRLARKEALAREKELLIRRDHIRGVLCAIAKGKIKKNRHFIVDGKPVTLQEDISHGTLLHVITLDRQLADGYNNWPSIERQFAHLTRDTSVRLENTVVENDVVENRQQPVTNSLANALPATGTTHKVNQSDRPD
ncbi:MAG: hypothetical protein K0R82_2923, partial [Flavipsychrobacter sp.]|nr:hypothetical protein [Flavipsychrobacter sp.]